MQQSLQVLTLMLLVQQLFLLQQVKHQKPSLQLFDDTLDDEMDETFDIALSSPTNATIAAATGTVTITDNDPAPTISINDVSTADENAASTNLVATLSAASGKDNHYRFCDIKWNSNSWVRLHSKHLEHLHLQLVTTTKNVPIAVLADAFDEPNETVTVTLSNPNNVTLNDATGI